MAPPAPSHSPAFPTNAVRELLDRVLRSNPFYQRKLAAVGVTRADQIAGAEDYARLPFTTKAELSRDQLAHPKFGTNLTEPLENYVRLHQTSGTTGRPLRWLDTRQSWDWWIRCWRRVLAGAGVTPRDRVFFAFSFGPFVGFWSAFAAVEDVGCLAIPGGAMSSEQRLHALVDCGATVLISTPTYALHLAAVAAREGIDLAATDVRLTIHAGEAGASIPATRARIEAAWAARCFDHAGATEVGAWGFECAARSGLHLNEDEFLFEVVDPMTGAVADEGELVITNFGRDCMPVIRYRTGDHVRLATERCACGSPFRYCPGGVIGRVDDAIIVRGVNIFPSSIEHIVRSTTVVDEFQVEVTRRDEMDEIYLRIEVRDDSAAKRLARELRSQLGLRTTVEVVAPGSLPRFDLKARRFIDRR